MSEELLNTLSSIISNATPLVIASIGETITERVGVVNLSLDGSIVLSAMVGFAAALVSGNAVVGLLAAMLVGAFADELAADLKAGRTPHYAVALQKARRAVRSKPQRSAPYYWAPFVLIGPAE